MGADCSFCHLPHRDDYPAVLHQKKHRTTLQQMTTEDRSALLAGALSNKLQEETLGPHAAGPIEEWLVAVGGQRSSQSVEGAGVLAPKFNDLQAALRQSSLRTLLEVLHRYCQGTALSVATDALMESLRSQAP